jgi:glutamine cyclotransferase
VSKLNELEWIKGELWANIWQSDQIARIDPTTGKVTGWIDLSGILSSIDRTGKEDVLNGIAYDAARDKIYVTGKYWSKLFEIRLKRRS